MVGKGALESPMETRVTQEHFGSTTITDLVLPCSLFLLFLLKKKKKKETSLPFSVFLAHNVARERSIPGTPGTQLSLYRTSPIFKRRFLVLVKAYFKFATKEFSLK